MVEQRGAYGEGTRGIDAGLCQIVAVAPPAAISHVRTRPLVPQQTFPRCQVVDPARALRRDITERPTPPVGSWGRSIHVSPQ